MRPGITFAVTALLVVQAMPLTAQNAAAPQPAPTAPPTSAPANPPAPAPGTTPPPVITIPPGEVPPAPAPVETAPAPQPSAPEPVTISPDAAYPNGFADPDDPFGNDLSLARQEGGGGFDWGLLGLLGLLGLIPLFRRGGGRTTRTVYVDRDDPRRVIREEQVED